ncbi:MAG: AAA family ATPase [Erysipelotrichaceae bacterium]|nr:AAA family ATPase [Erysipelotrichaceae bacterium]
MIIIITGPSHVGKTILAQQLLEKLKYPYLSIDHLKMGLIRSGNTKLTPEDDEELTGYLWPIIREIIKTAIENQQNLILEGCYIPFEWRNDFDDHYLPDIRFICLAMAEKYIDKHYSEITENRNRIEKRLDDESPMIEELKAQNCYYAEGFRKAGEKVFVIEDDYEQALNEVVGEFMNE